MTMTDIPALIATRACTDSVNEGDLLDDLELDPIDLWGLRDDIERTVGIEISDDDLRQWTTVGDVVRCVEQFAQEAA